MKTLISFLTCILVISLWTLSVYSIFRAAFGDLLTGWPLVGRFIVSAAPAWFIGKKTAQIFNNL